jgi:glutaredoxin-related protein
LFELCAVCHLGFDNPRFNNLGTLYGNIINERVFEYLEFRVYIDKTSYLEMKHRRQRVTVRQIFINGYLVGGYDELIEMDKNKQLEKLLKVNTNLIDDEIRS